MVGDGIKVAPELLAPPALLPQSQVFLQVADPGAGPSAQPPALCGTAWKSMPGSHRGQQPHLVRARSVPRSGSVPHVDDSVSPPNHPEMQVSPYPLVQGRKPRL